MPQRAHPGHVVPHYPVPVLGHDWNIGHRPLGVESKGEKADTKLLGNGLDLHIQRLCKDVCVQIRVTHALTLVHSSLKNAAPVKLGVGTCSRWLSSSAWVSWSETTGAPLSSNWPPGSIVTLCPSNSEPTMYSPSMIGFHPCR